MKKEAIFAIIIGIVVGLGITYGIYKIRQVQLPNSQSSQTEETDLSPTPAAESNQKLLITSPKDESVLSETALRISGTAEANEIIVIFLNDDEHITQADSIGAFAQDVELLSGGNLIDITAIAADGTETKQSLHVVVSTASLEETVTAEEASDDAKPTPKATTSAKATTKPTAAVKPTSKPTTAP